MSSIRAALNYIHADFKIFGALGSIYYRGTNNVLTELVAGPTGTQLTITAGAVPAWVAPATIGLADKSVTLAKLQDFPTGTILGRLTSASGGPEILNSTDARTVLGLGTAALRGVGLAVTNLVEVLPGGKIDPQVIPNIAIGQGLLVATNAAKLAIATPIVIGETLVRVTTDETRGSKGSVYIYIGGVVSSESSWLLLSDEQVDAGDIVSGTINAARLPPISPLLPLISSFANEVLQSNYRYYANGGSRLVLTLPTVAALGSQINITDISGLSFRIAQNAGQDMRFADALTIAGVTGYIEPTAESIYASINIECILANTRWLVTSSVGNFLVFS